MAKIEINTVPVTNGTATTEYTIPSNFKVGESTIHAVYSENDNYQTAEATSTATIKKPTTITVNDTLASLGQTGVFTATVQDVVGGTDVSEGEVQFKLNGANFGSAVPANNGVFTLEQIIPNDAQTGDEITAVYLGNSTYSTSTTTTAGVLTLRTDINITVPTVSANRGTTPTITAQATDGNGNPVTVGNAILKVDGVQSGETVTIDSTNGTFTFTSYTVNNDATLGSHTLTVEYEQNSQHNATTGIGSLIIRTPTVTTPVNMSVNPGQTGAVVQVNVRDLDNHDVTEGNVQITVGTDSAVTAAVSGGVATITYDVPANATGTIPFTANYIENTNFEASSTIEAGVITVRKEVTVQVEDINANLSDTITLDATVTSGNEQVNEGQLTFTIEE